MLPPQLFHKILGAAFLLLPCCAHDKPAGILSLPGSVPLPGNGIDGFIPGVLPPVDNAVEKVICQLAHRISRLERALQLDKITASGGKIFATSGKKADFHTTLKKCKEAGGSIATPSNEGENNAILHLVKSFNTYAYLGIRESLTPSKFQLLNGTQLNYTNWHFNEPSGKGKEECVEMYADGTWNDKRCYWNCLIVCQF